MRDAEAAVATREPAPAAVAVATPPPPSVPVFSVKPLVEQLIFQADSLQAVSRSVETQMKREGIPVLAATREFVEFAARPAAPSRPSARHTLKRTPLAPRPFDDRREIESDIDDLLPPAGERQPHAPVGIPADPPSIPPSRSIAKSLPVFDVPFPSPEVGTTGIDDVSSPILFDLSVAPFPGLAHHEDDDDPAPAMSFDSPPPVELPPDPPAIVEDHVFTDWTDGKNYHGNDHARAYDIDPELEDDVFAYEAYIPPALRNVSPPSIEVEPVDGSQAGAPSQRVDEALAAAEPVAEPPASDAAPKRAQKTNPEAAGIRNVAITHVLERITRHYRKRAQEATPRSADAHADAALEPDVAPAAIARRIPGQIAQPYMVVVHENVEIPKVPPYIWSAPELPWNCDEIGQNSFDSWFNCMGNRYQLALDLEM